MNYSTESPEYKMTLMILNHVQDCVFCNLVDDERELFTYGEWDDIEAYEAIALKLWSVQNDEDLFEEIQSDYIETYELASENAISFGVFRRYASVARQLNHFQINPARWD